MTKPKNLFFAFLILFSSCSVPKKSYTSLVSNKTTSQELNANLPLSSLNEQISDVVRTIFQDSKGNIWFGTQNGAFKLSGDSLVHIDNIKSETGGGVTIKDIAEDKDGKIWFGHEDGISSVSGEAVYNYYESDGLLSNDVWCIETDQKGNIWIGTIKGVCIFDGQKFTKFDLPEGEVDKSLGISSKKMIHNILEDSKGTMWFCTNAGLFSYSNNNLKHVSKELGIETNFFNKLIEDRKEGFWVSTATGLYYFNGTKLINITEQHFKEQRVITNIVEDAKGEIWFNSSRNIYKLSNDKLTAYKIGEENDGPLAFQIYEDRQKRLWFVGFGGAFRFENEKFINIRRNGPW